MDPQIPQYNPYTAARPYVMNAVYDISQSNEANTYNQIATEFQYLYGTDIVFLPRVVGTEESVFGEYLAAEIEKGINIRCFVEEMEAWSGAGDIFSKFGNQITDEVTIHSNVTSWEQACAAAASGATVVYPKELDLIWIPKTQKLWQIMHIENETAPGFYLFGNRTGYKISCKMFSYNYEKVSQAPDSNIPAAVAALDSLLAQHDSSEMVDLNTKDTNNTNVPIANKAAIVVDNTEVDPITGA